MRTDFESMNETMTDNELVHETEIEQEQLNKHNNEKENVGFWLRFVAYIIDVFLISCLNGILLSPLVFINDGIPVEISLWTLNGLLALLIYYLYFAIMTKLFQQTLGKMIVGIKVVQENSELLTWKDVFYREVVGRIIHNVFLILKLMYLVVAFTKEKQGIHDMIGNTKVVHI